ncbi:MAG: hypothetical protein GXO25_04095 [Euryarchaeota archaeon]|nr:hypothetical protein [Euryarchaeota archaeon]
MYAVFKFSKSAKEIDALYRDDVVARQTLIKRDGSALGLDDAIYIVVEGSEEAINRAKELAKEFLLNDSDAKDVYKKIKDEEESASMGMGALFG